MPKFLDVTDTGLAMEKLGAGSYNVTNYGAAGDGVADDTAEIHAARDAAGAGGRVFFPAGTYLVDGLTASVANQTWELADGATIKMKTDATYNLRITADGVTVRGGSFDGVNGVFDLYAGNHPGVYVDNADDVSIQGITVRDSAWYGIEAWNSNRLSITGCSIVNSQSTGIWCQNSLTAPSNVSDILIADNSVDVSESLTETSCIGFRGESGKTFSRVTVTRNTMVLKDSPADQSSGLYTNRVSDLVVTDNITSGGYMGLSCPYSTRATFSNNVIKGFSTVGIELPSGQDDVTVVGNTIDPDGNDGLNVHGIWFSNGTVNNLLISGNTITNFANASGGVNLIDFGSGITANRVAISGNVLRSSSAVVRAILFNGAVTSGSISGNVFDGATSPNSYAVELIRAVTGLTVSGNHFSNLTGSAVVMAATAAVTLDYIKLNGNGYVSCPASLLNLTSGSATVGSNVYGELVDAYKSRVNSIELGHATDTTVTRSAAGKLAVEGVDLVDVSSAQALTNKTITSGKFNQILDTNGNIGLVFNASSSAVNYLWAINSAAGNNIRLAAAGTDSNVSLGIQPKGLGSFVVITSSTAADTARFVQVASQVNYWVFSPSAAGYALQAYAKGSDSNISINVEPKGTGSLQVSGNTVATKVSAPATSTTAGKPGQWAAGASYIYAYTGDGTTHTWVRATAATW